VPRRADRELTAGAIRLGVPAAIAVAGVVLLAVGDEVDVALGVLLVGCAGLVLMVSALMRASARSNAERDAEERAREHFDRHGSWPGEDPGLRNRTG
jgi:hypothetical protein